jgi:hypothetical protein
MKSVTRTVIVAAIACAFVATPTIGGLLGTANVGEVSVNPGMTMRIDSSGYDGEVWVGVYNLNITNSNYAPLPTGTVASFCIDVWDVSPGNPSNPPQYQVRTLEETPDAQAGPMGDIRAGYLATLLNKYGNSTYVNDNTRAAALQAAVWEIADEGNTSGGTEDDLPANWGSVASGSGNFYIGNADVAALADQWLADVKGLGTSSFGNYVGLTSHVSTETNPLGKWQDYVVCAPVPLPGSVLLGVFAVGLVGRKLRKFV